MGYVHYRWISYRVFFRGIVCMSAILEKLPDNLHLARNSNAPENDRWRLYNSSNHRYLETTGASSPIECVEKYLAIEAKELRSWVS